MYNLDIVFAADLCYTIDTEKEVRSDEEITPDLPKRPARVREKGSTGDPVRVLKKVRNSPLKATQPQTQNGILVKEMMKMNL